MSVCAVEETCGAGLNWGVGEPVDALGDHCGQCSGLLLIIHRDGLGCGGHSHGTVLCRQGHTACNGAVWADPRCKVWVLLEEISVHILYARLTNEKVTISWSSCFLFLKTQKKPGAFIRIPWDAVNTGLVEGSPGDRSVSKDQVFRRVWIVDCSCPDVVPSAPMADIGTL